MNTTGPDQTTGKKRDYLFDRIGLYALIIIVLAVVSSIILALPYSRTYIGDYGADEIYLKSFVYLAVVSTAVLILGLFYNVMIWMEGKVPGADTTAPPARKFFLSLGKLLRSVFGKDFGRILRSFVLDVMLLRKFWGISKVRWLVHGMILFGFIGTLVLDIVTTFALEFFDSRSFTEPEGWGKLWIRDFGFDLFGLMIMIGLAGAIVRRFVMRPKQLVTGAEDVVSVLFLLVVVLSGFVLEGIGIASGIPGHESHEMYSFVGYLFSAVSPAVSVDAYAQIWFLHAIVSLALIMYIPFSKLFHMFAAPLAMQLNDIIKRGETAP